MRWFIAAFMFLLGLVLAETSLLPAVLGSALRPSLVLTCTAVWVALRGTDGLLWVFVGGFLLDLSSNTPVGLTSFGMLIGNIVAGLVDRAPIPSATARAATWVALVTVVSYGLHVGGLALSGLQVDVPYAITNVVLPLMVLNSLLAVLAYAVLKPISERLERSQAGRTIVL
ncbi:MAG: rod shape-determining protein MreD [Anaerolineae bacterium]|nr:rod shape-determining protein MreD [Thermoflexales bacterium]MDW8408223.1 rod shape-determining protein MreD [Anaerolineae bacterium]